MNLHPSMMGDPNDKWSLILDLFLRSTERK